MAKGQKAVQERKEKNKKIFIENFEKYLGNINKASKMTGISRQLFYVWKKDDEEFAQQCENIQESIIDDVESKLLGKINSGDVTSIIFYLKTKGRNRGYIEHIKNENINHNYDMIMKPEDFIENVKKVEEEVAKKKK